MLPAETHMPRPTSGLPLPPPLPRELVDMILTKLVTLHDYDPAYQWTSLRHITRFHKEQLEEYFARVWLPTLTITVYSDTGTDLTSVKYAPWLRKKRTDLVCFKALSGWDQIKEGMWDVWEEIILKSTWPKGDEERRGKNTIVRLGEGVLNLGYAKGGIFSDIMLPGLKIGDDGEKIWVECKALFSKIFGEEMVMRRFQDRLLDEFVPSLTVTKPGSRRTSIIDFLSKRCQVQRRDTLTAYRNHIAYRTGPFDISTYLHRRPLIDWSEIDTPLITMVVVFEESMVFHIPGWRTCSAKEIARLRATEEMSSYGVFPFESILDQS